MTHNDTKTQNLLICAHQFPSSLIGMIFHLKYPSINSKSSIFFTHSPTFGFFDLLWEEARYYVE